MDSNGNGNCLQKLKKNIDRTNAQTLKYKINSKIWLTLKNIATATENKKLDAKQTNYTIFEDKEFHNFQLNIPPNIRNVFHVNKLRAAPTDLSFPYISYDNHPGPAIIGNENGNPEYDVEKILKKKEGPRLPMFNEMGELRSFYLGANVNYKKHSCIK